MTNEPFSQLAQLLAQYGPDAGDVRIARPQLAHDEPEREAPRQLRVRQESLPGLVDGAHEMFVETIQRLARLHPSGRARKQTVLSGTGAKSSNPA